MMQFNYLSRKTLITYFLLLFILLVHIAEAKHIIVIYDVSGSMVSLTIGGETNRYMETDDIKRVNEYLTNILFTNTAQTLRDKNDSIIKECDAAYVGRPLYQSSDIITFAKYARMRNAIIDRKQVNQEEFKHHLPTKFPGQVSFLNRAKVEVYDDLYRKADGETFWIFVTDGIPDDREDPERRAFLNRLAEIEEEYINPMIFGVLVNNHVRIQVRLIEELDKIKDVFISNRTSPNAPAKKVQISSSPEGKFVSETITIKTHNPKKSRFKLNGVAVEVVDKFKKPIQTLNDENIFDIIEVSPVALKDNPPPYEFHIPFPTQTEILDQGNLLKLEVTYNYDGNNTVYTAPLMKIEPAIVYVSSEELNFNFSEGTYRVDDLAIQSENLNKKAFQIKHIRCHIQDRHNKKLCSATLPKVVKQLGETFSIVVQKQDNLDWYGNKVVLEIAYEFNDDSKSETIEIPYKLIGGDSRFPMWLLIIPLILVCCCIGYFLIRAVIRVIVPPKVEHHIMLTKYSVLGELMSDTEKTETLKVDNSLAFGVNEKHILHFDIGWSDCPDFLRCEKYSILPWSKDKGRIRHYKSDDDPKGEVVNPTTIIRIRRDDDTIEVQIQYIKDDNAIIAKTNYEVVAGSPDRVKPLDV